MISFVKNDKNKIEIEKKIFNSNMEYNLIAFSKKQLKTKDILDQYSESKKLKTERYLVKKDGIYIGILEYGMVSPRTRKPWLSLLIIDKQYHREGLAKEAYNTFENQMKDRQIDRIQIAVHAVNKKAFVFWTKLGFKTYDQRMLEGHQFYSLEKQLNSTEMK
ncbi:GNAT family N-acetyltransferase [Virgibacillus salexigens]|uniref:N-acetyltransferase domain-containing protein n=3 Tax=Virgibacillus TaxID=84406 RepID=A0ABQ2D485_9BACI|nr:MULTISPECIES: GNAT family N-acetyltransferase [Virgibacillus]MYL42104.1 GNAT family N-acetyltransferase [Virgibacillus massiliensis]GGJ45531.1 hypothetical protein GCM10007111_04450 [Virgibacillus kapii]CDQ39933.1 putative acetyltransferase [Virgibacillus massiliensis]